MVGVITRSEAACVFSIDSARIVITQQTDTPVDVLVYVPVKVRSVKNNEISVILTPLEGLGTGRKISFLVGRNGNTTEPLIATDEVVTAHLELEQDWGRPIQDSDA